MRYFTFVEFLGLEMLGLKQQQLQQLAMLGHVIIDKKGTSLCFFLHSLTRSGFAFLPVISAWHLVSDACTQ